MTEKEHWESVYAQKSAQEVSWFQTMPTLSLELIAKSGLGKEEPLIDVGSGASTLVDQLLGHGYLDITVLDIAASALAVARQRLGGKAALAHWLEADITRFKPVRRYSLWHDRAVFHFLTNPDDRARYVSTLEDALAPGGHVIIAAFAIDGPTHCSGLDIVQYDADTIAFELRHAFILLETCQESHVTPAGRTQLFNYFHFRRAV